MPSPNDFPARGKILQSGTDWVLFQPAGSTYQMRLLVDDPADLTPGPGGFVDGYIRIRPRKLWTVPSGGGFIAPIFGPPRTIQGRVRYLDESHLVLQAGGPVIVELPEEQSVYDLTNGPIAWGRMVNVHAWPGARFEPAVQPAAA